MLKTIFIFRTWTPTINSTLTTTNNGLATNYYLENEDTMEESDLEELEINLSPTPKVQATGCPIWIGWIS